MADLTARPDHWTDSLPGNWQQAINTNGILNALGRALSRQSPDMTRGIEHDQYGSVSDRNWLLEAARGGPPKINPLAAEMLDKGGLLANFLGPGVKLPAAAPKPTGIRAYHGSPHDFDRFDINKIGTGEGAQAYGRGLYFAESEGVAKSYRDGLAPVATMRGKPISEDAFSNVPVTEKLGFDRLWSRMKELGSAQAVRDEIAATSGNQVNGIAKTRLMKILDEIEASELLPEKNPGRMYEVRINADPEQFLDWDKPLAQQPEGVRRAVEKLPQTEMRGSNGLNTPVIDREGDAFYHALAEAVGTPFDPKFPRRPERLDHNRATQLLREAGIPGIKYLDQGSRAAGQGSRNYVVFDDKLIEILRKYGLLPPVAAGTAAALNQQEPPL